LAGSGAGLVAAFFNATYFPGLYGIVVILVVSSLYFVFYGRKQLVAQAPAEERALKSDVPPRKIEITRQTRQTIRKAAYLSGTLVGLYALGVYLTAPPSLGCIPNCMGMNLTGRYLEEANLAQVNTAYKIAYGSERVTSDPIHAGYFGVYLWKAMVEKANSTEVDTIRKALTKTDTDEQEPSWIEIMAPGGLMRVDVGNQHTYKIARIGVIREDGLIDEIFSSHEPIKPDPLLLGYEWAVGLFSKDGE
jgi:hypothetical protein